MPNNIRRKSNEDLKEQRDEFLEYLSNSEEIDEKIVEDLQAKFKMGVWEKFTSLFSKTPANTIEGVQKKVKEVFVNNEWDLIPVDFLMREYVKFLRERHKESTDSLSDFDEKLREAKWFGRELLYDLGAIESLLGSDEADEFSLREIESFFHLVFLVQMSISNKLGLRRYKKVLKGLSKICDGNDKILRIFVEVFKDDVYDMKNVVEVLVKAKKLYGNDENKFREVAEGVNEARPGRHKLNFF